MECGGMVYVLTHLIIHLICFLSILDIHFTTSVVKDVKTVPLHVKPLSRRIILFVADGLRADKFFQNDMEMAPYLREKALHNGTWGVSFGRPPTESRPAHIAILGGFYEDPAALRMLWKDNPVAFDSVFNRSRETWAWGASDVLPYLNKGSAEMHIHIDCHHYHVQSDLSKLDEWVFDKVEGFFMEAENNKTLKERLMQDKLVFFLHLAGIDSNGHRFDSQARPYLENIRVVDNGIRSTVEVFAKFFGDEKTAYIFTADHGMTDSGGHGGGHPTEVQTPLVAWGSGIVKGSKLPPEDTGGLKYTKGNNIEEVDLSVLMTSLIGVPYPSNSRGSLPLQYLDANMCEKAELSRTLAMQLGEQFIARIPHTEGSIFHMFFWPFVSMRQAIKERNQGAHDLIASDQCEEAIKASIELYWYTSDALDSYKVFRKVAIFGCIVALVTGWIIVTARYAHEGACGLRTLNIGVKGRRITAWSLSMAAFIVLTLYSIGVVWTAYVYSLLPVLLWNFVLISSRGCDPRYDANNANRWRWVLSLVLSCLLTWTVLMAFHSRFYLSLALLLVLVMPLLLYNRPSVCALFLWTILCLAIAIFPMFPAVDKHSPGRSQVLLGGVLSSVFCIVANFYKGRLDFTKICSKFTHVPYYLTSLLPTAAGVVVFTKWGYSLLFTKFILVGSWVAPVFTKNPWDRLADIYCWHSAAYVLLSHSYDALFFVGCMAMLFVWIIIVYGSQKKSQLPAFQDAESSKSGGGDEPAMILQSAVLLVFASLAIFGVYDVESFYKFNTRKLPFLPVTDKPTMVVLLLYKVFLHYLMISCSFCVVADEKGIPLRKYCARINILCDFMLLCTLYWVTDTGSWADIGLSIANLGIVAGLPFGILMSFIVARLLISAKMFSVPACRR